MEKWLEKIKYWSYDTLGLILPGTLFTVMLYYTFDLELSITLKKLFDFMKDHKVEKGWLFLGICICLYLVGNVIKIASQIFYDFFSSLFDKWILKKYECKESGGIIKCFLCFSRKIIEEEKWPVAKFLRDYLRYIFYFKAPKYFLENQFMIEEIIEKINKEKKTSLKKEWYSIYKISKFYEDNENIKSLSSTFLAKYTLYRSLSFIFFINFCLLVFKDDYLTEVKMKIPTGIFLLMMFISWLTFHIKYKKYYSLCGNETLVGLYYKIVLKSEVKKNEIIIY